MIGDTITVTINAVAYTLNRLDPGVPFGSDYYFRDATQEVVLKVRHSKESVRAGQPAYERHQIDLNQKVFATATVPERAYQAYTIIRLPIGGDPDAAERLTTALCGFQTAANLDKVVGWQS